MSASMYYPVISYSKWLSPHDRGHLNLFLKDSHLAQIARAACSPWCIRGAAQGLLVPTQCQSNMSSSSHCHGSYILYICMICLSRLLSRCLSLAPWLQLRALQHAVSSTPVKAVAVDQPGECLAQPPGRSRHPTAGWLRPQLPAQPGLVSPRSLCSGPSPAQT